MTTFDPTPDHWHAWPCEEPDCGIPTPKHFEATLEVTNEDDRLAAFAGLLEAEWLNGNLSGGAYERLNADLQGLRP